MQLSEKEIADCIGNLSNYASCVGLNGVGNFNKVHNEWFNWFFSPTKKGKKTIRQLLAHRGSYKTTTLCFAVSRYLLLNPDARIGIVRSSKEEGQGFINLVRAIMAQDDFFLGLSIEFGQLGANDNLFLVDNYDKLVLTARRGLVKEGNLDAIGYEKIVTGRHYDFLLFDDFVTLEDRHSEVIRKKKFYHAVEYFANILEPNGLLINLGTFWHEDDTNQRIKKTYGSGVSQTIDFEERVFPLGSVFKMTKAQLETHRLDNERMMGAGAYEANYYLRHCEDVDKPFYAINSGEFAIKKSTRIIATIDAAYGGGDKTAISIGYTQGGESFHVIGFVFKASVYDLYGNILELFSRYSVTRCYVESNKDEGAVVRDLGKAVAGKDYHVEFEAFKSVKSKQFRILSNLRPNWESIFFDKDKCDFEYLEGIRNWTEFAASDDAIDSLAMLISFLKSVVSYDLAKVVRYRVDWQG